MEGGGRIAVYSRKSRFTGKGESIDNQVELCREYLRLHRGREAESRIDVYEDEGFSGGNLNRPGFRRMMEAARKRELEAVVVYRLDRISRSIGDFSALIQELGRLGVAFISIREQFDTNSPMGRAMMYIASVFSQLERETIAERIRDNMHELAKTGRWLGGVTPTGYTSEHMTALTPEGKTKGACRLKLVPEEAELVESVFDLFLELGSLSAVEAELLRRRITTRKGREFTRFSIRGILCNPVYLTADGAAYDYFKGIGAELCFPRDSFDGQHGVLVYNRTDQEKGRAAVARPPEEWLVSVGGHRPIVSSERWIRAQEILERGRGRTCRTSRGNGALLTGLLVCRCGGPMYPKLSKSVEADGRRRFSYVCKRKERSRGSLCRLPNPPGLELDRAVLARLGELPRDGPELAGRLEEGAASCTGGRDQEEALLARMGEELAEKRRKAEGLVDTLPGLEPGPARELVVDRIQTLRRECGGLEEELRAQEERAASRSLEAGALTRLAGALSTLEGAVMGMTAEQGRNLLRALIRRVVWDGRGVHVLLAGSPPAEVEPTLLGEDSK